MYEEFREKIKNKQARVGIIGMGYVGLPIAMGMVQKGYEVIGMDTDEKKVEQLLSGKSYIIDVPGEEVKQVLQLGFVAHTNYQAISSCDVVLICVPTPLTESKEPDLSCIIKSVEGIIAYIHKELLIVLESTTYPGTTDELIVKKIEKETQYKIGEDFFVCFSPERVDPGNTRFQVINTPKVVGGATPRCMELGNLLYHSFLEEVVPVSSTKVAEMSKLLENTFRCINIAFINELTLMCERMNINIWEVIDAASSKPFGFMPFYPGPGIGGHCIPLDPMYLASEGKKYNFFNRFIELAMDINSNMPNYVVRQIQDILNDNKISIKDAKILLIGMAYKEGIDDLRESPSIEVYKLLKLKGAQISFYDPYVTSFKDEDNQQIVGQEWDERLFGESDLVVVLTGHNCIDYNVIEKNAHLIYDTRNSMKAIKSNKIIVLGEQCNKQSI